MGLSIETDRSIAKRLPDDDSIELSPKGPESVKKRVLFFSERTIELGPFKADPSKSLITGVISMRWSTTVWDRMA